MGYVVIVTFDPLECCNVLPVFFSFSVLLTVRLRYAGIVLDSIVVDTIKPDGTDGNVFIRPESKRACPGSTTFAGCKGRVSFYRTVDLHVVVGVVLKLAKSLIYDLRSIRVGIRIVILGKLPSQHLLIGVIL